MLAEKNRRAKLHETVARFLAVVPDRPDADRDRECAPHGRGVRRAARVAWSRDLGTRPWLSRSHGGARDSGFRAPRTARPWSASSSSRSRRPMRCASPQLATKETPLAAHVLELVAKRSGGNPQFLRDLLRTAIESGGAADLPDSAEAAAMARIDALSPDDRARAAPRVRVRPDVPSAHARVARPRTAATPQVPDGVFERLARLLRDGVRRLPALPPLAVRDAAYEGLPFKSAASCTARSASGWSPSRATPDENAGVLSLHFHEAGDHQLAWRYARIAAKRAEAAYADVEAAGYYARALRRRARRCPVSPPARSPRCSRRWAMRWCGRVTSPRRTPPTAPHGRSSAGDRLAEAQVLLKLAHADGEPRPLRGGARWAEQGRALLQGSTVPKPRASSRARAAATR